MTDFRAIAYHARETRDEASVRALLDWYADQQCALYPVDVRLVAEVLSMSPDGYALHPYTAGDGGFTVTRDEACGLGLPLCTDCADTIGGACAGPDDWRPAREGEPCGADACVRPDLEATITHEGIEYTATVTGNRASIDAGGHWACDGDYNDGCIDNAAAPLPDEAYALLEDALHDQRCRLTMGRFAEVTA